MFNLFNKKQINIDAAKKFWEWFLQEENWIITNIKIKPIEVINAIDQNLKPIFPYFKKELEFEFGINSQKKKFFLYHFNNKQLIKDTIIFKNMMPDVLKDRWVMILEK